MFGIGVVRGVVVADGTLLRFANQHLLYGKGPKVGKTRSRGDVGQALLHRAERRHVLKG